MFLENDPTEQGFEEIQLKKQFQQLKLFFYFLSLKMRRSFTEASDHLLIIRFKCLQNMFQNVDRFVTEQN